MAIMLLGACQRNRPTGKSPELDVYSAEVTFEDSIHHFGRLPQREEPYSCSFSFVNTGKVPVVVLHADPSCRCTSVVYNKKPVPVNGKDSIVILFDSEESGKGYFGKTVRVRFNSDKIYTLKLDGSVE